MTPFDFEDRHRKPAPPGRHDRASPDLPPEGDFATGHVENRRNAGCVPHKGEVTNALQAGRYPWLFAANLGVKNAFFAALQDKLPT